MFTNGNRYRPTGSGLFVQVRTFIAYSATPPWETNVFASRTRSAGVVAALTVATAACGAAPGTTGAPRRQRRGGVDAKTATSAADFGGLDKLVEAAKKEGKLNVIALPPDWANYGEIIEAFKAKYGIKVESDEPRRVQRRRDQRGQDPQGPGPRPRRARPRPVRSRSAAPPRACSPRTRSRPGTRSPTPRRTSTGPGTTTTAATCRSAATPRCITAARRASPTCSSPSTRARSP